MADINEVIFNKAGEILDFMVGIRRTVHKNPELGMKEFKTSALICAELDKMGIPYRKNVGGTGVVGLIKGTKPGNGKVLALRADIDALPIQEISNVPYKSEVPGIMHACGHDAHVAILLGAAKVINDLKSEFSGTVKLVFQPAEEGPGGAEPMIKDGVLKDPDVDAIVGLHVFSDRQTGKVGLKPGNIHAAQDEFRIKIKGHGGHAAYPHKTIDAIVLAAQAVNTLQTVVSRRVDPLQPAVLTVGTIKGGYRHNIIADVVEMDGTYRYFDMSLKPQLRKWTEEILTGVTRPVGGDFEVEYLDGYPATVNNSELYKTVKSYLEGFLPSDMLYEIDNPSMGAEDFSYYGRCVPAFFFKLGSGGMNGEFSKPGHCSEFDIDEKCFVNGAASFVKIALEFAK